MGISEPERQTLLRSYWAFHELHRDRLASAVTAMTAGWRAARFVPHDYDGPHIFVPLDDALVRDAILHDRWQPYLDHLQRLGQDYALTEDGCTRWLAELRGYRDIVSHILFELAVADPEANLGQTMQAYRGLNQLLDTTFDAIGDAYLRHLPRGRASDDASYRLMFERNPTPMWMYEAKNRRFTAVNDAAARLYGYERDQLLTMSLADIQLGLDAERAIDAPDPGGPLRWRHRTGDGRVLLVEERAEDLDIGGRSKHLASLIDVTEQVRMREALAAAEQRLRHSAKLDALGLLAGGIAHDFNNLVTVVESYACLLEESLAPDDERRADASEIRRAGERAATITRQLLAMSRPTSASPRALDLNDVIRDFTPMLRRLTGSTISIVSQLGEVPAIFADRGQLEQVLMNLAVNARDAMNGRGRLVLETAARSLDDDAAGARGVPPGAYVELSVTDTGTGMPPETVARIFEPYFTTKAPGQGTGLGLSIVHGIVSQLGGAVAVYSELGHGTAFRLYLPVSDDVAVAVEAPPPAPVTLPPLTILLVEDQHDVRTVAARVLREAGCQVLEAASADEAERACVRHEGALDLAVLDLVLPDGRGDLLVHDLRALRPGLRFLVTSGYPAGALAASGTAPLDLLVKPFTPGELRAAVARVCGAAPAEPRPLAGEGVRKRVLVVEDDRLLRITVVRVLDLAGFECDEAGTLREAIAAVEATRFDVVVSDVNLPLGTGLDLLRAIRRVDLDVPVILMTGGPTIEAAADAVRFGAFRYLTKPFDIHAFVRTVEQAYRGHALARIRRAAHAVAGARPALADRASLEVRYQQAVESLWMAYQPIVQARTGVLRGVEVLMRSDEPSLAHPGAVLDAAASLGRTVVLGRRLRELAAAGLAAAPPDWLLFVNLHASDLSDAELLDPSSPLARLAPQVVLEVTERAPLEVSPELHHRIERLRELGFRIAVDDVGAGYSGLSTFAELAPELIKIDMSLVRDVHRSALKQRTIAALCRLCREGGTLVVAEGVESIEERDTLIGLGCDLLQGYLFGAATQNLPGTPTAGLKA